MQLTIRYKKRDRKISQALQERVDKKTEFIQKHLEVDHPVHLILEEEKTGEIAELSFHFHGVDIISKSTKETLYEAIDEVIQNCGRQMEKSIQKMKHHKGEESIKTLPTDTLDV
jgi:ribosomal subunit interface protein